MNAGRNDLLLRLPATRLRRVRTALPGAACYLYDTSDPMPPVKCPAVVGRRIGDGRTAPAECRKAPSLLEPPDIVVSHPLDDQVAHACIAHCR